MKGVVPRVGEFPCGLPAENGWSFIQGESCPRDGPHGGSCSSTKMADSPVQRAGPSERLGTLVRSLMKRDVLNGNFVIYRGNSIDET